MTSSILFSTPFFAVLLLLLLLLLAVDTCDSLDEIRFAGPEHGGVYCETEAFNASCDLGSVILMTHARYGRMRLSRCVKQDYGHVGCAADVLDLADTRCSARRQCTIRIPDALFATTKPCPDDLKPYLEARYVCVRVETPVDNCNYMQTGIPVSLPGPGFLANLVTEAIGCGSPRSPWIIRARPGQTIRLTLLDFTIGRRHCVQSPQQQQQQQLALSSSMTYPTVCQALAIVREPSADLSSFPGGTAASQNASVGTVVGRRTSPAMQSGSVASIGTRESLVYTSVGHVLEVAILTRDDLLDVPYFMIKYEVVGCPNISPGEGQGSWYSVREGDRLTIHCNNTVTRHSETVYHLHCRDNKWTGDIITCLPSGLKEADRQTEINSRNAVPEQRQYYAVSHGLSAVIALVTAIVIGLLVLGIGLAYFRSDRRRVHKSGCARHHQLQQQLRTSGRRQSPSVDESGGRRLEVATVRPSQPAWLNDNTPGSLADDGVDCGTSCWTHADRNRRSSSAVSRTGNGSNRRSHTAARCPFGSAGCGRRSRLSSVGALASRDFDDLELDDECCAVFSTSTSSTAVAPLVPLKPPPTCDFVFDLIDGRLVRPAGVPVASSSFGRPLTSSTSVVGGSIFVTVADEQRGGNGINFKRCPTSDYGTVESSEMLAFDGSIVEPSRLAECQSMSADVRTT